MGLLNGPPVCSDLHYIPKHFHFSSLASLQKKEKKNQTFAFLVLGSYTQLRNTNRKHGRNEGDKYAAMWLLSGKRGCAGKPL